MDAFNQLFRAGIDARDQGERYFTAAWEAIYYRQAYERAIPEGQREPSFSAFMGRRMSRSTSRQTSSGGVMGPPQHPGAGSSGQDPPADRGSVG